jgi:hypothetical protein
VVVVVFVELLLLLVRPTVRAEKDDDGDEIAGEDEFNEEETYDESRSTARFGLLLTGSDGDCRSNGRR